MAETGARPPQTIWLVTNRPARAAIAACGQYPPPPWLRLASDPAAILAIGEGEAVFAIRYGAAAETDTAIDQAWAILRRRMAASGRGEAGLSDEQFARLRQWRIAAAARRELA